LAQRRTAAFGVHAILTSENDIVGRKGRAIRPKNILTEIPGDGGQIFRNAAIGNRWNLVHQPGHHHPIGIVAHQRFNHQRGGFQFLRATRQIRVQAGRRLPEQDVHGILALCYGEAPKGRHHHHHNAQNHKFDT